MAANFSLADLYGPGYGYQTTRGQSVPEQNDQEALQDDTAAAVDVQTSPNAKRNIIIAVIVAFIIIVLFSLGG